MPGCEIVPADGDGTSSKSEDLLASSTPDMM